MKSSAARYNYKRENLFAALLAIVFLFTVGFKVGEQLPILPVKVLLPKEKKEKDEEEMSHADSVLLDQATPGESWWKKSQYSVTQRNMIIEWARERFAVDTLQIAMH